MMGAGLSASEADGCAGVKLLYEAIGELPDDLAREVFAIATQWARMQTTVSRPYGRRSATIWSRTSRAARMQVMRHIGFPRLLPHARDPVVELIISL